MATDPFTLVYDAVAAMVTDNEHVQALVSAGNIILYSGTQDPREGMHHKPALAEADVPELRLMSEQTEINLSASSSGTHITEVLAWHLRGGSLLYDRWLNPVRWALIRSSATWADAIATLQWNNKDFVVHGLPLASQQRLLIPDEESGGKMMWACVMRYQVLMAFTTDDL
jgi:hypothetical protein